MNNEYLLVPVGCRMFNVQIAFNWELEDGPKCHWLFVGGGGNLKVPGHLATCNLAHKTLANFSNKTVVEMTMNI